MEQDNLYDRLAALIQSENERILQDQHKRIADAKVWGLLTVVGCLAFGVLIGRLMVKR